MRIAEKRIVLGKSGNIFILIHFSTIHIFILIIRMLQALDFAVKCAAQFSTRLRRLEDEYLTVSNRVLQERCLMLQQQVKNRCDEIHTQQISLLQIWTRRNDELLVCEKSCLLEILAKQVFYQ
jgi:hypothetical protein